MNPKPRRAQELAPRIHRLRVILKQFREGRRKLYQLHGPSEGRIREEIEHALAVSQAAMEIKERELAALEAEMALAVGGPPDARAD